VQSKGEARFLQLRNIGSGVRKEIKERRGEYLEFLVWNQKNSGAREDTANPATKPAALSKHNKHC
jgi:hypothetical protein